MNSINTARLTVNDLYNLTTSVYEYDIPDSADVEAIDYTWSALVDLWESIYNEIETSILHDAVSYIKYGVDIDSYSSNHKLLIEAVYTELCSDSSAGRIWRAHSLFRHALEEATPESDETFISHLFTEGSLRISLEHCHYLEQRMMYRYWNAEGKSSDQREAASKYIASYESFITKLCPAVSTWVSDYWIDINHIFDALQNESGHDYRADPGEYDILINVFRMDTSTYTLTGYKEDDYLRCVCNLKHLSMSWAKALWEDDAEKNIIKFYHLGENRARALALDEDIEEDILTPCYVCDVSNYIFSRSWIYTVVQNWITTGKLHTCYKTDYKKAMLEISLGV